MEEGEVHDETGEVEVHAEAVEGEDHDEKGEDRGVVGEVEAAVAHGPSQDASQTLVVVGESHFHGGTTHSWGDELALRAVALDDAFFLGIPVEAEGLAAYLHQIHQRSLESCHRRNELLLALCRGSGA